MYLDRESSGIVTLCNLFGRRGGAVVSVDNNLVTGESFSAGDGQDHAIDIAFDGLANLHKMDTVCIPYIISNPTELFHISEWA